MLRWNIDQDQRFCGLVAVKHFDKTGQFDFGDNLDTLFDEPADDVFMVKFNYWLNP